MKRLLLTLSIIALSLAYVMAEPRMKVSLLTCSEGRNIYELEGHSALRLQTADGSDCIINWGVFDFNAPNFIYRFVKGETDYMVGEAPTEPFVDSYRREGRSVLEQTLRLDSLQTERLMNLIYNNFLPQNRVYRYNYVYDNCATRPLAMIERAIGDTLTLAPPAVPTAERSTFRNAMRHFHSHYPWYQFGIDTALGSGIDTPISEREAAFAPLMLADMIRDARLPSGERLVESEHWLAGGPDAPSAAAAPTPLPLTPMSWSCVILCLALIVSVFQMRGKSVWARWFDTAWFTLTGLEGLVITFLIFVSVHEATSPNWLYLWLNPLCFIGAITPWLKSGNRLEFCYQSVNFALLIALGALFVAGVQSPNPAFIPLMSASGLRAISNIICRARRPLHPA